MPSAKPVAIEPATPSNTAVLTIGSYPHEELESRLGPLLRSARRFGADLHIKGVGEEYQSHYVSKVVRMRRWIEDLHAPIRYVLYVDGGDSFFCRPLGAVCDAFRDLNCDVLVGAESTFYPCGRPEWKNRFPARWTGRRSINAGMWMGCRESLCKLFSSMAAFSDSIMQSGVRCDRAWKPYRRFMRDDQFLWQACYTDPNIAALREPIVVDSNMRCFANVTCGSWRTPPNRDFALRNQTPIARRSGASPGVLHFPGRNRGHVLLAWAETLGLGFQAEDR
ncbi:hypothetical protein KOR34_00880 [Posidoniimonas corsicana]|uniref:PLOD1-3-like GT domain-containing protein n=1 Tax=Posidoniimonas corsicana TaxID=1938618 RepID=A0A5C5VB18_9BACT|nr:hypothetical protein KOR34_00880 [Posidoniimonas corsicana]